MKKSYISPTIYCVEAQHDLLLSVSKIQAKGNSGTEEIPFTTESTAATSDAEQQGLGAKSDNFSVWDD